MDRQLLRCAAAVAGKVHVPDQQQFVCLSYLRSSQEGKLEGAVGVPLNSSMATDV
jgi:hypothetical protein